MSAVNNLGNIIQFTNDLAYSNVPDNIGKTLAERLYYTRMKQGLTMKQLAEMTNITYATISRIEKDGKANLSTIKKLADSLNISIDWLRNF